MVTACAPAHAVRQPEPVIVNVVGGCPPRSVPGAAVELRGADGRLVAEAVAGIDGAVSFRSTDVAKSALMIACHEDYACGAVKLEAVHATPSARILIALAPLVVAASD